MVASYVQNMNVTVKRMCLVLQVPMLASTGNHEIEAQSDGNNSVFKSVQARWKVS